MDSLDYLMIAMIIIAIFVGYAISEYIHETKDAKKVLNGLWTSQRNWSDAYNVAKDRDQYGNWICINLKGMNYDTMLTTIQHEIGHELFAQECESNVSRCIDAIKRKD